MQKDVNYPEFIFHGVTANHRGYPLDENLRVFGADTETFRGSPLTLQCYDGEDLFFDYVKEGGAFDAFTGFIAPRCRNRGVNIVYFHYLKYDLPMLFFERRLAFYEQISEIELDYKGWHCKILFGKVNKATLEKDGLKFHIFDSWAFTQAGLAASLDMYKIPHPKMDKSKALEDSIGRTDFQTLSKADPLRLEFEAYAKQDAMSEYHLGVKIMDKHKEYKVRPSISLPQFASRVFRHHFFEREEVIPFPKTEIVKASEFSYHGGKNGYYLDKPQIIEGAYEIDISSAFPYAMSELPQFIKGFYVKTDAYDPDYVGVYLVSGADTGRYPIVFDHAFKPIYGKFSNVWITGHELKRALESPDVKIKIHYGFVWIHDDEYKHNPMREYVKHFYKLKQSVKKEDANYYFYKTMMNGLYGKFAQVTDIRKMDIVGDRKQAVDYSWDSTLEKFVKTTTEYRAGGLYNPFIASQITGFVRGYLYDLEIQYDAFHSATDAVKTSKKPHVTGGLGGLKIETRGRCFAFRNKLYLHFAESFDYCEHSPEKIKYWDGRGSHKQHLCKYALHGFKGSVGDLFEARHRLMRGESLEYAYDHMVGLREGFRRRETIGAMIQRREILNLMEKSHESASASQRSQESRRFSAIVG